MKALAVTLTVLTLASCGYVGDPLPPSLNIPPPVEDLRVEQRGSRILIRFTLPGAATDGVPFQLFQSVELEAGGQDFAVPTREPGPVELMEPVAPWVGRTLEFRVRAQGPTGRWSEWSPPAAISVIAPLDPPSNLAAMGAPQGVRLSWESPASNFRVLRESRDGSLVMAGETVDRAWLDEAVEFGSQYAYRVQAVEGTATSEESAPITVFYEDRFPPSAPAEVQAVAGLDSIELTWQPPPETDLAGFLVYRAAAGGVFQRLDGQAPEPSFSDGMVESGMAYRYAVSAIDVLGNESPRSPEVIAVAP